MTSTDLAIDAQAVSTALEEYIRQLARDSGKTCVAMGLSGGVDSAVLATLAVRALGPEHVLCFHLCDRDSDPASAQKAKLLADRLKILLEIVDFSSAMRQKGIYAPFIMRISAFSQFINRMIQHSYYALFRETPHKSTLKAGCGEFGHNPLKRLAFNLTIRHIETGFNARHIHRRKIVEAIADEKDCLVLGAANRSEGMVGWFVKDGIDDLPIQPMLGLYKTQVWQLADYLELPDLIRHQPPSPDMMKGITDEFAIGMRYARLDEILDYLNRGLNDEEILSRGITANELQHVQDIHRLSTWKRASEHVPPPLDGGVGSPYRKLTGEQA